jgi:hypothetical protein
MLPAVQFPVARLAYTDGVPHSVGAAGLERDHVMHFEIRSTRVRLVSHLPACLALAARFLEHPSGHPRIADILRAIQGIALRNEDAFGRPFGLGRIDEDPRAMRQLATIRGRIEHVLEFFRQC